MSLSDIKDAIAQLPPEERRELIRFLTPRIVKLTPEERARIKEEVDSIPEDEWIDWGAVKAEYPV